MERASEVPTPLFEGSIEVRVPDGWITPNGTFYGCTPEEHDECAKYLLQTDQVSIKKSLETNQKDDLLADIAESNPRLVLQAAGYALLSSGLLVESNIPESLTMEQLEFMEKNELTFTPESGRLQSSVYLEFKDRLKKNSQLVEVEESLKFHDGRNDDRLQNFQSFIENPTKSLVLEDLPDRLAQEIYEFLASGDDSEDVVKKDYKRSRTLIRWRGLLLPSGNEAVVQHMLILMRTIIMMMTLPKKIFLPLSVKKL